MAFFSQRVADVKRALTRSRKGEQLSETAESDIRWLERTIGLDRPLQSYSARSQRRIFQRLNEGAISRKEIYQKEYQAAKQSRQSARDEHGLAAHQWRAIKPLRDRIVALGVDADPYMDDEILKDFAQLYGYEYLHTVLTQQIDSTERYLRGDAIPGRERWNARGELEDRFGASVFVMRVSGTNPYYYYHGRRA